MTNRQQKLLKHLKDFIKICEENDIFYIASDLTLLASINKKGLFDEQQKIQVNMTIESYDKLKKLVPNNIIDASIDSRYPEINPKFLPLNESFYSTNIFIDILIIVPTTIKKVSKWCGLVHKNNFLFKKVHSKYIPYNNRERLRKVISFLFRNRYKQFTHKMAYNKLYASKNEGLFTIHKPNCKAYKHWIPHLTYNTLEVDFEDFKIKIPEEWKTILKVKYGENYKKIIYKKPEFKYINSVSIKKIKTNKNQ
ncbi:LicD family protein [Mycoplasma marinum]|uniref:LicD family protein n=1 Tax=Mycoplasma marinum TaxID=1937190 RepID=A0A4R0XTF3_9MOLU|nr:LicD family protein [Mycoplasma marinum]TCG10909.1 hypothetical protein C4B24_03555 [Mycoplasma marinum]